MCVGDVKGYRRKFKVLERMGHTPKRAHSSIADSIARERMLAGKVSSQSIAKSVKKVGR